MQITLLKQKGKSESFYVELDGENVGTLELETIVKNHLKEGVEIDQDQFNLVKKENDKLVCFSRALKYISSRLKTEKQMREYLKGLKFDYSAIDLAIEKLKNYGYLNDEYYAKTFVEMANQTKGKRYIRQELLSKGVAQDKIEEIIEENSNDDIACKNVCTKWLKNKTLPLDPKNKEWLYRFLLSRGFDYDTIKHTLNELVNAEI